MKNLSPYFFLLLFIFSGCKKNTTLVKEDSVPNIIFLLIDDIGIISTPPYSSDADNGTVWSLIGEAPNLDSAEPYETPNMSRFASEAKRLNYMYATPSCAPSRAQLLTGLYPFNTGIIYPAFSSDSAASVQYPGTGYLSDTIDTYVNKLQDLGYYTGFGGKYNLRYGITDSAAQSQGEDAYNGMVHLQEQHLNVHGFDETFGPAQIKSIAGTDTTYTGGLALIGNTVDYHPLYADGGFFPSMLHDWGRDFIEERQSKDQPFYLHYCFGLIHDSDPEAYPDQTDSEEFASKVQLADTLIGEILTLVEDHPNTVVIIAGDNGTETYTSGFGPGYATTYHQDTIPGGKLTFQSRGSRVPFLIRWPEVIDNTPYDELVDFADVFGTINEIAGGDESTADLDGNSFLYQITNGAKGKEYAPRQAVYSQLQEGGFVANKKYLYLVDDVYTGTGESWYDISASPQIDDSISVSSVNPSDREMLEDYFQSLGTIGLAKN